MAKPDIKSTPNLAGSGVAFAHAVKAGPFIFLTGHEAFDFSTGADCCAAGSVAEAAFGPAYQRRQADFILARMKTVLAANGADLSGSLRLDQYYPSADAVTFYQQARRAAFGNYIPPSTSVIMERCFAASSAMSVSLIAAAPDTDYRIGAVHPHDVAAPGASGFVLAITCNDFIFIAGQMATGADDGLHESVRLSPKVQWDGSAIRRQTAFLIREKLKPAMEAAGSSLDHVLKAQVYLDRTANVADFLDVWRENFVDIPCALTIVPARSFATVDGVIEINLIGLKADAVRKKAIVPVTLPEMAMCGPCVRAGEFVFPSGLMAIDRSGAIAGAPEAARFEGLSLAGHTQAHALYESVEAICAAAGTTPDHIVRAQYFVDDIHHFNGISDAWRSRYGDQPHPFACIVVPPLLAPGAVVTADFWIYAPA
jgi:enamine deaminase RidA (YjgF/YER057c/UK114 family)